MDLEEVVLTRGSFASLGEALDARQVSCLSIAGRAIERIARLDRADSGFNALITVNPALESDAARLDSRSHDRTSLSLYGVPVVIKDNIDVAGMPCTGGAVALRDRRPAVDAAVVSRLRRAGALIVGKANLSEFARTGTSASSLGGQALNPADLSRTPGGSSGGSASGVAAGFALASLGTDTSQSVRSPASATGLFGMRPTDGLVSRHGVMPVSSTRDAVGPIARSADDAEALLFVISGGRVDRLRPTSTRGSDPQARGARSAVAGRTFGVPVEFFGNGEAHERVEQSLRAGVRAVEELGGRAVPIALGTLVEDARRVGLLSYFEWRPAIDRFLSATNSGGPMSLHDVLEIGKHDPSIDCQLRAAVDEVLILGSGAYHEIRRLRVGLRSALNTFMIDRDLAALLYPHQQGLVAKVGHDQLHRNGFLASSVGFPAVCFPGEPQLGIPVGLEIMGAPHADRWLLAAAGTLAKMVAHAAPLLE